MIEEYIDRIVFLETHGVDAVYAQREQALQRMPYEMERIRLRFVAEGKPKELIDFCLRTLAQSPELRIPIGRTSKNKIRHIHLSEKLKAWHSKTGTIQFSTLRQICACTEKKLLT